VLKGDIVHLILLRLGSEFSDRMDGTTFPGLRPPKVHSGQRKLVSDQIFLGLTISPRSIHMKKRAIENFDENF
jgi:hypothetical protein